MAQRSIGIIMNGVTGRMGYRQHLVRSVLALRDEGGVRLRGGERVQVRPLLVGRDGAKLAEMARRHDIADWTTDLDAALGDDRWDVYADFLVTKARVAVLRRAIAAGKAVYTEKPTAETVPEALELAALAQTAGVPNGVVHDKLYLPGMRKLARLVRSGFFGRILSVRGEFGYWVFEGDGQPAQRPSWNYRAEDGGGIVVDMFPHWNYVLENLFGEVRSVYARAVTHIPTRFDENGASYSATADDAAYAIFELDGGVVAQLNSSWAVRVNRKELVEFQVDGTHGSAVAGLFGCRAQHRTGTPRPVWNPDLADAHDYGADWSEVPDNEVFENGFRVQWEEFVRHVVDGDPHPYDLLAGARGVRLAEAGLESSRTGARVELPPLEAPRVALANGAAK
ncbi:Gfo/Idh/MocA family protein [Amycolatopsis dendrobii]|uniref:Gfo/Idh/MocA family oxidoreductase n=1 Tax=Amycolatopsis dendrobii TaxID=2760662 RepID=A0A7W3W3D9_9PSEU|nr:Gfo/Idh/MocA family oxidoreductase [Amycolatopsis dendrobii]MBB1158121.1 Gfo/Idh/MocA family oxidoreductase [Amycolatopsis dendrobii]